MDTVMFHTGRELPSFLEYTFKQFRLFNPVTNVYFLTDKQHVKDPVFSKYKIMTWDKCEFYSDKIRQFETLFNYGREDFWTVAATRFIYIENFLKKYRFEDVYHFENDILIYYTLADYESIFKKFYHDLAITVGGEIVAMSGFMFIKNSAALSRLTQYFVDLLSKYGIKGLIQKYHIPMINEMFLIRQYQWDYPNVLRCLPTMPVGEFSQNYELFDSIFDPASYGQFVGGTRHEGPGAKPQDHYIGRWLTVNPDYDVIWYKDEKDRRIPYLSYDNNEVKINNLHIHSKNLDKYMSL